MYGSFTLLCPLLLLLRGPHKLLLRLKSASKNYDQYFRVYGSK